MAKGQVKLCSRCHATKGIEFFDKDESRRDGRKINCVGCQAEINTLAMAQVRDDIIAAEKGEPPPPRIQDRHSSGYAEVYGGTRCEKCNSIKHGDQCQNCLARIQHSFDTLKLLGGRGIR